MVKLQGWNFEEKHGFSGSCGKTEVRGYMRGGPVKKAGGGMVMPTVKPPSVRHHKSHLGGAMKMGMPKPMLKAPVSMSGGSAPSIMRKGGRVK
jgi:hypothetical protein